MRSPLLISLTLLAINHAPGTFADEPRPNIVFIFIDDLGYGDLSCYGNSRITTPNIDRLADEGTRFTQFYVASPICSPSRVGITTGQFPARHRIHSYLASRQRNRKRGMADFLDPSAPAIARTFQSAGYATAHFGKWHMGGGRDVDDAPLPQVYGFDESLVSFEGLGDRVLPPGGLSTQSEQLGRGNIEHAPKHKLTEIYVNRSIDFIQRNKQQPFYLHVWLNDVHDPFAPTEQQMAKFTRFADNKYLQQYYAVIDEMDRQIGRLVQEIDRLGLSQRTLIVLAADNGPTAWPRYEREGLTPPGSTGGLRGRKWSLYEGGIREPLIVRWKGHLPAGRVDEASVMCGIDFFPTFCALANIKPPDVAFDGTDLSRAFLGEATTRHQPLFWEYGRDKTYLRPARPIDRSPNMAIRDANWKLLMNADGTRVELYDLSHSPHESQNTADRHPEITQNLSNLLTTWRATLPRDAEATKTR